MGEQKQHANACSREWRTALGWILLGYGVSLVSLNFGFLILLSPALSCALLWLGARKLRRENDGFQVFWALVLCRIAYSTVTLLGQASSRFLLLDQLLLAMLSLLLQLSMMLAFWVGYRKLCQKLGQPAGNQFLWLFLLTAALWVLTLPGLEMGFLALPLLLLILLLLYRQWHHGSSLPVTEDLFQPAPCFPRSGLAIAGYLAAAGGALLLVMLLGNRLPMNWHLLPDRPADAQLIAQELIDGGMPEAVAADLSDGDLYRLAGGEILQVDNYSDRQSDTRNNAQDVFELTQVVLQTGSQEISVITHFSWLEPPRYRFTDALTLDILAPGYEVRDVGLSTWLYATDDGISYTSRPFFQGLRTTDHNYAERLLDKAQICALFSLPQDGTDLRGYVLYPLKNSGIDENAPWTPPVFAYHHQHAFWNYPACTPLDNEALMGNGPFFSHFFAFPRVN